MRCFYDDEMTNKMLESKYHRCGAKSDGIKRGGNLDPRQSGGPGRGNILQENIEDKYRFEHKFS